MENALPGVIHGYVDASFADIPEGSSLSFLVLTCRSSPGPTDRTTGNSQVRTFCPTLKFVTAALSG
jgi:hypothetical protein